MTWKLIHSTFLKLKEKHFTLIGWENNAFRMLPFAYASIRNRIVFLHISLKSTKRYSVWKIYSNANNLNNFKNGSALHKEILKWTKSSKYIEVIILPFAAWMPHPPKYVHCSIPYFSILNPMYSALHVVVMFITSVPNCIAL